MAEKHGGGAEKYARFKQYDYRAVSVLLIRDTSPHGGYIPQRATQQHCWQLLQHHQFVTLRDCVVVRGSYLGVMKTQ